MESMEMHFGTMRLQLSSFFFMPSRYFWILFSRDEIWDAMYLILCHNHFSIWWSFPFAGLRLVDKSLRCFNDQFIWIWTLCSLLYL